jgi:hypothetical protein
MNNAQRQSDTVCVEEITREILSRIDQAETQAQESMPPPSAAENNLYEILRLANQSYPVTPPPAAGLKGHLRLRLYALLAEPFQAIATFHVYTLRALNKITKLLDGTHDDLTGELLTSNRNRMDLIEALSHRVAQLEKRIDELEGQTISPETSAP